MPGGDEATQFPDLWDWLVDVYGARSVLDVGCGDGQAVDHFVGKGCFTIGIDGVPQKHERIICHDYTTGPYTAATFRDFFDLVWCCEFVEHVEERYVENFLPSLRLGDLLLMTHAFPGQGGYHHVNCRTPDYWVGALAAVGYRLDPDLTAVTRALAARNPSLWNHYVRSGLAFRRYGVE